MSDLVKFQFHGDDLQVIPEAGDAWVVVKRVCEALGVSDIRQWRKLKENPAATTAMMAVVAEDGRNREMFCISVRSLPLWLATIHPSKVSDATRAKLIAYQREAAEVLAEHFLGKRTHDDPRVDAHLAAMADRLAQLEAATSSNGMITGLQQDHIKTKVELLARQKHFLGHEKSVKAASTKIQNMIRSIASWGGTGELRRFMPSTSYPRVCAALHAIGVELDRELRRRRAAAVEAAQRDLFN